MRSLVLLCLLLSGVVTADAHARFSPLIHYFDPPTNSLIIERADGTEHHPIPQVLPHNHNTFVWLGSSSSLSHFALGSFQSCEGECGLFVQIISRDGASRSSWGEFSRFSFQALWSPQGGLLFVSGYSHDTREYQVLLINVADDSILAQTQLQAMSPEDRLFAEWSSDGLQVRFWATSQQFAFVSSNEGEWEIEIRAPLTSTIEISEVLPPAVSTADYVEWISANTLMIIRDSQLYRYDVDSGRENLLDVDLDPYVWDLFPSPDGRKIGLPNLVATIIDVNGRRLRSVTPHNQTTGMSRYGMNYRWHPDSQWVMVDYLIAYSGGGGGPLATILFDLEGTTHRELPVGGDAGFLDAR